jgi:hypothetical protein
MQRRSPVVMWAMCVTRSVFTTASKETPITRIGKYNRGCGGGSLAPVPVLSSGHEVVDLGCRTVDGIFIIGSGLFWPICKKIVITAIQKKIPLYGCNDEQKFLAAYHHDGHRVGIRAAWYADKIFKGSKPTDLPVERPISFELVINLKTAKLIGLNIAPNMLATAQRVIK